MSKTLLRIDASASNGSSVTRKLTARIAARLNPATVITRDLAAEPLPQIDAAWVSARAVPPAELDDERRAVLALSDSLIDELKAADTVVIGVPIYNFGIPASLKAWVDLIARTGITFRYTEKGPEGLLSGKRVILAVASGGVAVGSEADFATGYMKTVLGFVGITDVQIVAADRMALDAQASLSKAESEIEALAA